MDTTFQGILRKNVGITAEKKIPEKYHSENLGQRVRQLRAERGLTQNKLAELSGLSHSALSKIENNQLSPTFESILKIVGGLNIDVSDLLTSIKNETPRTRQVFTRKGRGEIHETENYQYETLCNGIINKKMIPIVTKVKSHSLQKFGEMIRHSGEELFYVLEGTVDLITEHYASVKLEQGDCAYFDSSMGHACISTGEQDALIFWVSTPS